VVTVKENRVSGTSNPSNIVEIKQASSEFAGYLHLKQNSADVNVNDNVARGQRLALTGDTGVGVGAYHLHFAVTDMPDGTPGFVTFPVAFSNYEIRDATGNWDRVFRGIPKNGEVIRAAPTPNSDQFLQNESWTGNPYYGSRGTHFADVTGDRKADAIVVNDDKITVHRSK
jgi:murein DD-endopeptidase MepM/ murein hydrolase activator NlpD